MGNRPAKPVAVSARVLLAAGLGALGWTFFSATTAAASDESVGLPALEAALQTVETPAAELTDPAAAAVDAVVSQATSGLSGTPAPAAKPAPTDPGVVQEIGALGEDIAPVVEAPATEVVQAVVPPTEVVQTVVPAVEVVAAPVEVVTAPVEQVLEPVTDELRPAVPILPEPPAVPVTDSEPAPEAQAPAEPAAEPGPTQAEPASQVAETASGVFALGPKEASGSAGVEEVPLPSDGPEGFVATAEAVDLQAQPPSMDIVQLPAPDAAAGISRATEVPSPTAGPIPVAAFPVTSGGSSGGGGGGSAGHGSADAYVTGGQYQWVAAGLAHRAESIALPASPVFDPGSTPD